MVQLDYQTNNPRWGLSGIKFSSWQSYSFVLGYLSNPAHNYELNNSISADISMRIERNDKQGAWNKEGRIHFYGAISKLENVFKDLYDHSSRGVGLVTKSLSLFSLKFIFLLITGIMLGIFGTISGYNTKPRKKYGKYTLR